MLTKRKFCFVRQAHHTLRSIKDYSGFGGLKGSKILVSWIFFQFRIFHYTLTTGKGLLMYEFEKY